MVAVYHAGSIVHGAVNDIPPGPELDSTVATYYLDQVTHRRQFPGNSWIYEYALKRRNSDDTTDIGPFAQIPAYSYGVYDRNGPAFELVNYVYDFSLYSGEDGAVWCELDFSPPTEQDRVRGVGTARGRDFPTYDDRDKFSTLVGLAICRAALDGIRNLDDEGYAAHIERVQEKAIAIRR